MQNALSSSSEKSFRDKGDFARDSKNWADAENFYFNYLLDNPNDAAIWVQLGHAQKEQNKNSEAETSYLRAATLAPEDSDAFLHLGRIFRIAKKNSDAIEVFCKALNIKNDAEVYKELKAMGRLDLVENYSNFWQENWNGITIYYDVTDLFGYLKAHQTLSGIQRVQANIIQSLIRQNPESNARHFFVFSKSNAGNNFSMLQTDDVISVINYATGDHVEHKKLRELIEATEASVIPVQPVAGEIYMILGAFWGLPQIIENARILRHKGLIVGLYVYDLIPITHPEFCDWALAQNFALSFGDILTSLNFILTISDYVAVDVQKILDKSGMNHIPVNSVKLAHVLKSEKVSDRKFQTSRQDVWRGQIASLKGKKFVVSVSTIEARKNHVYLFRVWRELIAAGVEVPQLVFVGRAGWRVDDLMSQIKDTNYLNGKIEILHDLSDYQMSLLYKHSLFSVFPSFVEGWGLPVGESLSNGTPCVASSTSSVPEVGGDLVDYIDPLNLRDGIKVIERMIVDEKYLSSRKEKIKSEFVARTWDDVSSDLVKTVCENSKLEVETYRAPAFPSGAFFSPSNYASKRGNNVPDTYFRAPLRAVLYNGWYGCEDFGVWMREERGEIIFSTSLPEGEEILAYIELIPAPHALPQKIRIFSEMDKKELSFREKLGDLLVDLLPGQKKIFRLPAAVGKNGIVHLSLELEQKAQSFSGDNRRFSIGLKRVAWASRKDIQGRQDIFESIYFQ